jgi:hypothetical protein
VWSTLQRNIQTKTNFENMDKRIPKPFQKQFKTFEEFRDWSIEKNKHLLTKAFEKVDERNLQSKR